MSVSNDRGDESNFYNLGKYFLHGILFSLPLSGFLLFIPLVLWIVGYSAIPLTFEPLLVLFVIVYIFLGLFAVLGTINSLIAQKLWLIQIPHNWQNILGQGVILFTGLCLIQLPVAFLATLLAWTQPGGLFPSYEQALIVVLVLSVVITPIPNGILCKYIAKRLGR